MHKGDAEDDSDAKHASQQEKTFKAGPLPERTRARNAIKPVLAIVTSLYDKEKKSNVHTATSIHADGYERPRGTATVCSLLLDTSTWVIQN
jgi:formylmethanofuran:tetrahydromethanopterin formyltransferase